MNYRRDIEGLRAAAVLPVVAYHAGADWLKGGFVGVDVFFVISGYLITRILVQPDADGRVSLLRFYERRIRRILPALFVLVAFVLAGSARLFLPDDFAPVQRSALSALGSVSNLLFYSESGYFAAPSQEKPLLHTWSLAVEEQFYLVFPLILLPALRLLPRARLALLGGAAVLSLIAAEVMVRGSSDFAFFMAPTRAWELLAGALLALSGTSAPKSRVWGESLAVLGAACIGWAMIAFSEETPFPGLSAVLPVAGATMLLYTGPATVVGRTLSFAPLVWIGRISYSLYLWHWPLIVFAQYRLNRPLGGWNSAFVIGLSLLAAAASYRWVEQPFRRPERVSGRQVFATLGIAGAVLAGVALFGLSRDGWPSRFSPEVLRLESYRRAINPRRAECHRGKSHQFPLEASCRYGADVEPSIAIWSDSHGVELSAALGELVAPYRRSLIEISYSSCPPVLDLKVRTRPDCRPFNARVADYLTATPALSTVVLVSMFDNDRYADGKRVARGLRRTIARLDRAGKRIIVVYPIPRHPAPVPETLAKYQLQGLPLDEFGTSSEEFRQRTRGITRVLDRLKARELLRVRPANRLCSGERCATMHDGEPLYFDDHHLDMAGARYVSPLFSPALTRPAAPFGSGSRRTSPRSDH